MGHRHTHSGRHTMVLALLVLGGCDAISPERDAGKAPNTGLETLGGRATGRELRLISAIDPNGPLSDSVKQQLAAAAAMDLQSVLDTLRSTDRPESPPNTATAKTPNPRETAAKDSSNPNAGLAVLGDSAPAATPVQSPTQPAAADSALPSPDPKALEAANQAWSGESPRVADPLLEVATNMAGLLKTANTDGSARIADGVALAAIEAVHPGSIAELESASSVLGQRLAADDRAALLAARQRILTKPDQANQQLIAALTKIAPAAGLKISRAALCTRVQGFGRYDAIGNSTFVAGQPIRLIVYTELDHFASRPAQNGDPAQANVPLGDQQSVELSQTLTLYHDPSGLQAWHRPAQRVVETSQRARRDFYLIHQIELPATLSVGRYSLKVTVTDQTTGAVDEVNLPISITGDASAVPR